MLIDPEGMNGADSLFDKLSRLHFYIPLVDLDILAICMTYNVK